MAFDYPTRLVACLSLAIELGTAPNGPPADPGEARKQLMEMPLMMRETLTRIEKQARLLGHRYVQKRAFLCLGSGPLYPVALEMALRLQEMSQIPAIPMSLARYLHGGIGLTDEETVTVILAQPGPAYEKALNVAKVTHCIKTPSLGIVLDDDEAVAELVDDVIRVPKVHDALAPLLSILPAQLISYYIGVARPDGNPDVQRTNIPKYARAWAIAFPPKSH